MFKNIGISKLTVSRLENDLSEKIGLENTRQKRIIFKATLTKYKKPSWSLNLSVFDNKNKTVERKNEKPPKKIYKLSALIGEGSNIFDRK